MKKIPMAQSFTPQESSPLSWLRVGTIALFAIPALVLILFDSWSLVDFTERDARAIPHFPPGARFLQLLTMLACLASPFILLGLLPMRARAFGTILGFLIVLASTTLTAATTLYWRSSAARVYFAELPNESPSFLWNSLAFTFLAGLVIIGVSIRGGKN